MTRETTVFMFRTSAAGTVLPVAIGPMVPLTTAANSFAARILAAQLGAEGVVWELRGNVDGPYPVGPVVVLVSEDDLLVAREIVGEHQATGPEGVDVAGAAVHDERTPRQLWMLLVLVLLAAALLLGRLLAVTGL